MQYDRLASTSHQADRPLPLHFHDKDPLRHPLSRLLISHSSIGVMLDHHLQFSDPGRSICSSSRPQLLGDLLDIDWAAPLLVRDPAHSLILRCRLARPGCREKRSIRTTPPSGIVASTGPALSRSSASPAAKLGCGFKTKTTNWPTSPARPSSRPSHSSRTTCCSTPVTWASAPRSPPATRSAMAWACATASASSASATSSWSALPQVTQ